MEGYVRRVCAGGCVRGLFVGGLCEKGAWGVV